MNRITLTINGMACGMCEAHVNDTVRKVLPDAMKIKSSHKKGKTEFLYEKEFDHNRLIEAIRETGYECTDTSVEQYQKKGFFGR